MSYALMKDAKVMCRGALGAEWHSILASTRHPEALVMTWPTREGATLAAEIQGAAVIPINQLGKHR